MMYVSRMHDVCMFQSLVEAKQAASEVTVPHNAFLSYLSTVKCMLLYPAGWAGCTNKV